MFRLVAPATGPKTTTLLPNPEFSDTERLRSTLVVKRAVDGSIYTFVKRKGKAKSYLWDFNLTRLKAWELLDFYRTYSSNEVIAYWNGDTYRGYIKNNPVEASTIGAAPQSPGGEYVRATIELEEK